MNIREDVDRQFRKLEKTEDGWYDGKGLAIAGYAIDFARRICDYSIKLGANSISVWPEPNGKLMFESIRFPNGYDVDIYMDDTTDCKTGLTFAIFNASNEWDVYDENLTEDEINQRLLKYSGTPPCYL